MSNLRSDHEGPAQRASRDASNFDLPARGRWSSSPRGKEDAGELMDGIYARQRHFYDATRKYFLLGRDRLIEELTPPHDGTVLEIGCGTGRNLIAAARAYPDVKLYGLDVSTKMLAKARASLRLTGLEERITLACGDAASFDPQALFGRSAFDRVFFSYSLSMIPAWRDALLQAHEAVAPGHGRLFIVDFGQQDGPPGWFRRLLFGWLTRFHVTPRAELEDALAVLRGGDGGLVFRHLYRGYASYAEVARQPPVDASPR